jgi:hypothetical protein
MLAARRPLTFGVFRSADGTFGPNTIAVGSEPIVPPGQSTPTLDETDVQTGRAVPDDMWLDLHEPARCDRVI